MDVRAWDHFSVSRFRSCLPLCLQNAFCLSCFKVWVKKKGPHSFAPGAKTVSFRAKVKFKGCYWIVLRINLRYNTSLSVKYYLRYDKNTKIDFFQKADICAFFLSNCTNFHFLEKFIFSLFYDISGNIWPTETYYMSN